MSSDGRFVAFRHGSVFLRDRLLGVTTAVVVDSNGVPGNQAGYDAAVSDDGRYVAFGSWASNLVVGDTNGQFDIFVHDMQSGATRRVNVDSSGVQANDDSLEASAISADGRYVAFTSIATNLVVGDTNGAYDAFVHDCWTGTTTRVSVDSQGAQANSGSDGSTAISADGRFIAFHSYATNLVDGDTNGTWDVFVHDMQSGATIRATVDSGGLQTNGSSEEADLSPDGRHVVFTSYATNLVPGDTNGKLDVFVRDLYGSTLETYCTAKLNSAGCSPSIVWVGAPSVTPGTRFLIGAVQVLDQQTGILFYGVHGPSNRPFQGGFLCVSPPTQRTPLRMALATGAPPCTGVLSFDFNRLVASGVDPSLELGGQVWAQFWTRDGASPSGTGLTDALTFTICQ